ncbi:transcription repressor OFP15-like [Diospyros lotus]|uniref:transcription repressor OFP15-like n=1 Tax=Diospyros lotus TaxID=55363 RepID=UPI00225AC971|nr:transcription repressor OFP15-like [Diospyros lotus]
MKLPFLFRPTEGTVSWPWQSCGSYRTLSFRANSANNYATVEGPAEEDDGEGSGESIEAVIRGLRSAERLFFEPGETSSITGEPKRGEIPFKESVVVEMESENPFVDFKRSMEEMVEAQGLRESEFLEELLNWYLRFNDPNNHGYVIGAFVDLLVDLAAFSSDDRDSSSSSCCCCLSEPNDRCCSSTSTTARSPTSALSFFSSSTCYTSPCLSSLEGEDEIEKAAENSPSPDS